MTNVEVLCLLVDTSSVFRCDVYKEYDHVTSVSRKSVYMVGPNISVVIQKRKCKNYCIGPKLRGINFTTTVIRIFYSFRILLIANEKLGFLVHLLKRILHFVYFLIISDTFQRLNIQYAPL